MVIKSFTLRKWKEKTYSGRKYLQIVLLIKDLPPDYTGNSCNPMKRQITQFKMEKQSLINMSPNNTYKWLRSTYFTTAITRKMQIKATMRYHLMHPTKAAIKKTGNSKCWWGCREIENIIHCWWDRVTVQLLWNQFASFLKMYIQIHYMMPKFQYY